MPMTLPGLIRSTALVMASLVPLSLQAKEDARIVIATGEGEASAAPDHVEFIVGIDVTESKVETAKSKSDEVMHRILEIAKQFKLESRDIQSDYMRIQPIQENPYNGGKPTKMVISYNARRDVRILLRDISKYDALLAALFNGGVNNLHSLRFKSTNQPKLEGDARNAAIKDAKSKAEAMAQQLGLKLGKARSVAEGLQEPGSPHLMTMAMEKGLARGSSTEPTLAPGEVKVRQQVTVVFEAE